MDLITKAIKALEQVNITDIKVYDLESANPFYNYVIVATGTKRQSNAVLDHLKEELANAYEVRGIEGKGSSWLLVDLGNLIIHIFDEDAKDYYKFDERFINVKELKLD